MCGIVGVLGHHEVAPLLVEALKRLEYRGYDSAGIATVNNGRLDRRRAVGKLVNLSDLLVHDPLPGKSGIGHTRWATHGAATVVNAHPHKAGPVAVVHNGIIENFRELRAELAEAAMCRNPRPIPKPSPCMVQRDMAAGATPVDAARSTLKRLHGAFALCFLFDGEQDLIIAARKGSPLAIGHGDGEMYVGSDAIALAPMTDRVTYLEEGDWAVVTRQGATVYDAHDRLANRAETRIQIDATRIEKAGYKHFMAKEIAEQPVVIADALKHYTDEAGLRLPEGVDFTGVDRITLVACGTASYACHVAKYWFEQIAGLPAEIDVASEFRYREPPMSPTSWALFVSQSGETADTLAALRYTRDKVAKVVSVVNVPTSSIARESDLALPIMAGVEVGVASTKAFTCQLTVLALLALKAGLGPGPPDTCTSAGSPDHPARPARPDEPRADAFHHHRRHRRRSGQGAGYSVPRARRDVSDGPGRRAEAQGNQLHPRRRLCVGRIETRPHRPDRRRRSGDRAGPARCAVRQDRIEHARGDGPPWPRLAAVGRRRCGRGGHGRVAHPDPAAGGPGLRADPVRDPRATAGLPHGHRQGHRCGPAPQSGEIRDGGMMAKQFDALQTDHLTLIADSPIYFVATAAPDARVNLSPKGMDSLRVLTPNRIVWLNVTGSGNETAAHLPVDPRMTLMWCSFGARPIILRAYGMARAVHHSDADWPELAAHLPDLPGARQIFDVID